MTYAVCLLKGALKDTKKCGVGQDKPFFFFVSSFVCYTVRNTCRVYSQLAASAFTVIFKSQNTEVTRYKQKSRNKYTKHSVIWLPVKAFSEWLKLAITGFYNS